MIAYQRETVAQVRDDIMPLLMAHYAEIGQRELQVLPDWNTYLDGEKNGRVFILTARSEGELVGYNVMFLLKHPHYADAKVAQNDVIFVADTHRGGKIGFGLVKYFEATMRQCGYDKIYYHAKPANNFGRLLERMGYAAIETIHAKHIGRAS